MSDAPPIATRETKICSDKDCEMHGAPQTVDSFYMNNSTADGLTHYCKLCHKRRAHEYRKRNPEKVKAWHRTTVERNKARNAARRAAAADTTRYVETD